MRVEALRVLVVPFLALAVGLPTAPALAQPGPEGRRPVEVAALVAGPDGRLEVRRGSARSAEDGRSLARRWRGEPGVVAADVAVAVEAFAVPSPDPLQSQQWGLEASRTTTAWESGDARGQVVAVVDSGADLDHPDLSAALVRGRDLVDDDDVPEDLNGHGTHVAGTVAALAGNGVGGAGAALGARVMPVRVLDATGSGSSADVAQGVVWAVDNGATVVNLSLGGPHRDSVLERAVGYALSRGVPVVAAAGNQALEGDPVNYPAALPGVVAVGAVDRNGVRASFSSTGDHLSVVAPGVGVVSTVLGGGYGSMSGTSMATPFVAASAALLRAADPALTPSGVAERLRQSARDLGPVGWDRAYGWGSLDAAGALAPWSPIAVKHASLGGDAGLLGPATAPEAPVAGGRVQTFRGGTVWWSAATAAHEVHGAVLAAYLRLGATAGQLRFPTTDERGTPDGRGRYNHFERGSLYWTPWTGAREVRGGIRDTWARLGWERSAVGYPTTDERGTPDGRGRYNHFERGSVYWTPWTGAREVRGGIRDTWARLGWERSAVGYPTTDERGTPDGRGRYNHFERGSVYWTPWTGAREVRGGIRDTWARLGWERSAVGYPTTDERGTPDGRGRYNHFERGSVYWTPWTGAHEVRGAIRDRWAALGWERSGLGYPTSDEYAVPGGRAHDFERGRVWWDAATGAVTVTGR